MRGVVRTVSPRRETTGAKPHFATRFSVSIVAVEAPPCGPDQFLPTVQSSHLLSRERQWFSKTPNSNRLGKAVQSRLGPPLENTLTSALLTARSLASLHLFSLTPSTRHPSSGDHCKSGPEMGSTPFSSPGADDLRNPPGTIIGDLEHRESLLSRTAAGGSPPPTC